jgi:hypothetical protein
MTAGTIGPKQIFGRGRFCLGCAPVRMSEAASTIAPIAKRALPNGRASDTNLAGRLRNRNWN